MTPALLQALRRAADTGEAVEPGVALEVLRGGPGDLPDVMAAASAVRRRRFGDRVRLCSILNAKSGACPEDCAFCAQSARHATGAETYALCPGERMVEAHRAAAALPVGHFGIVTSGETLDAAGVERLCGALRAGRSPRPHWCASLGALDGGALRALRNAGLRRFHHNLETAESFFPGVCTTHPYADRLATVRRAKAAGLEVCSGGILGMGETDGQRVEFALTLRRERVDAIPLNFLVPVPGTRLGDRPPMKPLEMLRCIAVFRLLVPGAELKVCAGRTHLRDLQSMIFHAGATGMMIGDLLTVAGRDVEQDLRMLADLEVDDAG